MKKFIRYSLILSLMLVISLFINFKVSDKIVVNASGPKFFQVGDVLPATTPQENTYLTFQSTSSFTLKVSDNTKHWNGTLYYSTDTTTWNVWDGTTTLSSVGNKLYLRGTNNTKIMGGTGNYRWVLTGTNIECIGNIENLLDYETVALGNHPAMANYCYANMFNGCTELTTAPSLPATTLTNYCYYAMFSGCTGLTTAPSLPATTLATSCYRDMFSGCTGLTTVPGLPATTLATSCYYAMFSGCSSFKVSKIQTGTYQYAWRIPTSGIGTEATSWNYDMLLSTGGTFRGTPTINTIYYVENPPVIKGNITFEENGGTTILDIEEATELPNPLPIPTKFGYTFRGWYYDSDFTNEALAGDLLTGDVILYAKWQENYRIFFNTNGGNSIPSITTDIIPDNLPIPERNNDIFIGWYYDESLSDPVETNDILSSAITIYASWIDYDSIIEYFYDIYKNGFDDGYDDNFNHGFNQGYDLGFPYGYAYGYDDGYRDGLMEDHPIEFSEFFDKGFFDARDKYGKQIDDYQWESAQIAYENGQKSMGRYSRFLMYGIVIITIIGGVILYYSLKRGNE